MLNLKLFPVKFLEGVIGRLEGVTRRSCFGSGDDTEQLAFIRCMELYVICHVAWQISRRVLNKNAFARNAVIHASEVGE